MVNFILKALSRVLWHYHGGLGLDLKLGLGAGGNEKIWKYGIWKYGIWK